MTLILWDGEHPIPGLRPTTRVPRAACGISGQRVVPWCEPATGFRMNHYRKNGGQQSGGLKIKMKEVNVNLQRLITAA